MKRSTVLYVPSLYPARGKMVFPQHWRPACNGVPCLKPKDILRFTLTTKNGCLKSCITALLQTWSIFNLSFHLFAAQHYLAWHIQFSASFSLFKWFVYEISGWAYVTLTKIVCVYVCISRILSFYSVFYKLPGLSGFC